MATRDRTRAFIQLRSDAKAKIIRRKNIGSYNDDSQSLKHTTDSHDLEAGNGSIPPGWVDVVGETNRHVARIKEMSRLPN